MSFLVLGCKKEKPSVNIDCSLLVKTLGEGQRELIAAEMDSIIASLDLNTSTEFAAQEQNLKKLVNKLNECENITAVLLCTWCIETLPEQSEISLSFRWNGSEVKRVADFIKTEDNRFRFSSIHD